MIVLILGTLDKKQFLKIIGHVIFKVLLYSDSDENRLSSHNSFDILNVS